MIKADLIYSQLSVLSVLLATLLYARFTYILGKYWDYLIEREQEVISSVFVLNFVGVMLVIMAYMLEITSLAGTSIYYFKFFGTALFLIAGIGLNTGMEHYRQNIYDLERKYLDYLKKEEVCNVDTTDDDLIRFMADSCPKIVSVYVKGFVFKPQLIKSLNCSTDYKRVYVLGPTHPIQLDDCVPSIWLSSVSEKTDKFITIAPSNLTGIISIFSTTLKKEPKTVFLGDFLETLFENESSKSVYNFLNIVTGLIRSTDGKLVFVLSDELTNTKFKSMCKNISDWIIEVENKDHVDEVVTEFTVYDLKNAKKQVFQRHLVDENETSADSAK